MPTRLINIAIVDDDASITRLVETLLQRELGATANIAAFQDTLEARHWIDQQGCDLLLSDIEMPACDGLEMLRFAKNRNAWTQVVFMTAHSSWGRINQAIESGASDYLLKPLVKEELLRVVLHECARITRWRSAVLESFRSFAAV